MCGDDASLSALSYVFSSNCPLTAAVAAASSSARAEPSDFTVTTSEDDNDDDDDGEAGGEVVNVRLSGEDGEIGDAQWRRIAYGSVSPFALLQSRRNSISSLFKMDTSPSLYQTAW